MPNEYISMHDEIMSQKWVIGGPLLELCVLSLVTEPKSWKIKITPENIDHVERNISQTQILENRYQFLINIILKIKEMKPTVEIIEDYERICNEIKLINEDQLINKNKTRWIDMKIYISIGYKRPGRMMLEIISERIIKIKMMYVDDDYRFRNTKELKKLLSKMIQLFNGICGSIGHENDLSSIIKAERLPYDDNIYGFYDIKWNHKVKWRETT